ncbi:hypothetical protein B6U99_03430 [Candidatus Geothermarchaeota archaeon ex4572_27]|nr:MAG: hypothetical protein B6U99_03430 [Candidatus Geothermarchaeota archaeon ex4572_27]
MELRERLARFKGAPLVIGFSGYTDAASVASFSIGYLIRRTRAERIGELRGGYYVMASARPITVIREGLVEEVKYPSIEVYASSEPKLLMMRGEEPNVNWEGYLEEVMRLIDEAEVSMIYTLGGMIDYLDSPKVSAVVNRPELRRVVVEAGVDLIDYEGPCSVYTALLYRCRGRGVGAISLWGHVPFTVYSTLTQLRSPDLKTSYLTLEAFKRLSGVDVDLDELRGEAERFMEFVERVRGGREGQPSKFYNSYIY